MALVSTLNLIALAIAHGPQIEVPDSLVVMDIQGAYPIDVQRIGDLNGDNLDDLAVGGRDKRGSRYGSKIVFFDSRTGVLIAERMLPEAHSVRLGPEKSDAPVALASMLTGRGFLSIQQVSPREPEDDRVLVSLRWRSNDDSLDFVAWGDCDNDGVQDAGVPVWMGTPASLQFKELRVYSSRSGTLHITRALSETVIPPIAVGPNIEDDGSPGILCSDPEGASVICFSGSTIDVRFRHRAPQVSRLGWLDDLDDDGIPDYFVLGVGEAFAPYLQVVSSGSGRVIAGLTSQEPFDQFGSAIAVGDVDGDGYRDLVIGASGHDGRETGANRGEIITYSIAKRTTISRLKGWGRQMGLGTFIKNVGDCDGDGLDDYAVIARFAVGTERSHSSALVLAGRVLGAGASKQSPSGR